MRNSIYAVMLVCGVVLSLTACDKEDSGPGGKQLLTGNWRLQLAAGDSNGNGVRDPNESTARVDTETLSFTATGSATRVITKAGVPATSHYNYELTNADKYLKMIFIDGIAPSPPNYLWIETLSSGTLIVKDTTGPIDSWRMYVKR